MNDRDFLRLKAFFPHVDFDKEEEHYFRSLWSVKTFNQYDLITEAGNVERYFYFVLEGVQAIYILNDKGEKVVLGFSYSGSPSGAFDSFIKKQPSDTFLEALKPSKMLAISYEGYQSLFEKHQEFYVWGHEFFQHILFGRLSREVELLTLSAEQRYIAFMQRCPKELKVIPQKYLASYLNMKPETFSRLRSGTSY
ncbi:Crp/Fnr family transcriptional regulator [Flagellimonas pacifica]|uniref:cAMP-binding domain of CRP or a regulatory subunit of cAMP-dependent protein kinases n=1 Tax=Flagellimonas pacifica TaxID=1247520 RepID=A0A285MDW0_9FLAO|nr:Crp/Fnr family transcriptional regulator [Allomuricauda parva]SNY94893.1 cAMP-binding domain of CRP or a regulatory subunit of cAMP-dependent protein kinases [Allomuricauda parva]